MPSETSIPLEICITRTQEDPTQRRSRYCNVLYHCIFRIPYVKGTAARDCLAKVFRGINFHQNQILRLRRSIFSNIDENEMKWLFYTKSTAFVGRKKYHIFRIELLLENGFLNQF